MEGSMKKGILADNSWLPGPCVQLFVVQGIPCLVHFPEQMTTVEAN